MNKAIICSPTIKKYLNKTDYNILLSTVDEIAYYNYDIEYAIMSKKEYSQLKLNKEVCFIDTDIVDITKAYFKSSNIPANVLNPKKLSSLELNSIIMNDTTITIEDKYVYTLVKSYLDYTISTRERTHGNRWIKVADFRNWVKLQYKTDVFRHLRGFRSSIFVKYNKTGMFQVKSKKDIIGLKYALCSKHILEKDDKFSLTDFKRLAIEFLHALPIATNRTVGIDYISEIATAPKAKRKKLINKYASCLVGATNQAHIAKLVDVSQARVSQVMKDFLKIYTFNEITKDEYTNKNFEFETENGVRNPIVRKYSLETGVDLETGEINYETRYYALVGSKAISHIFFYSSICGETKRQVKTIENQSIEITRMERRNLPFIANSLNYSTLQKHTNHDSNIGLSDKMGTRHHAFNNTVDKSAINNPIQIVAFTVSNSFDKLTSFTLKDMLFNLIASSKVGSISTKIKKMKEARKQLGYSIYLINEQLKSTTIDSKRRYQLEVISNAYNRVKNLLKSTDERIMNFKPSFDSTDTNSINSIELDVISSINEIVNTTKLEDAPF